MHPTGLRIPCALGAAGAVAILLASCTTYVRRIQCEGGPYKCSEPLDVAFCEYVADAVDGADCAGVGLASGKGFCVVTHREHCAATHYALKDGDCRVVQYTAVREWRECSPGTPTFTAE